MITSIQNPKIQWVRSLQNRVRERRESQAFVVEGVRLAEEALAAEWEALWVLHSADLNERGMAVVEGFAQRGAPVEVGSEIVLQAASDTQTPQGILVVVRQRELPFPERLNFALIVDGVRDPGNLGTILRTAAAAGVQAVFSPPGAVDPFSPKVVRSGMGAHFRLPIYSLNWEEITAKVQAAEMKVLVAAAEGSLSYDRADLRGPTALVIGGEAEGAGEQARRLAQATVYIPMPGGSESLNAASAAAIFLFEVVRQRRSATLSE